MTSEPQALLEPVRVVIVDDVADVREGLARLLSRLGIAVVGVAGDGIEALEVVAMTRPQVVVMDLRMPRMDGVEATRRILARDPDVAVLMLSAYADDSLVVDALTAGACDYLLKGVSARDLARTIMRAAAGSAASPAPRP